MIKLNLKKEYYNESESKYTLSNDKFEVIFVCSDLDYDFYYSKALDFINSKTKQYESR